MRKKEVLNAKKEMKCRVLQSEIAELMMNDDGDDVYAFPTS